MKIELTDQQARAVRQGRAVEVVDPATRQTYFLIAREVYERGRGLSESDEAHAPAGSANVPPGIRRSQEAYWRNLPELLKLRSKRRRWVAYRGEERVGFAQTSAELYRRCLRRGFQEDEFYVDRLEPRLLPPWEAEEIDAFFPFGEATLEPPPASPS